MGLGVAILTCGLLAACYDFGTSHDIGGGVDAAVAPDVVVLANVEAVSGDTASVVVIDVLLDDAVQYAGEPPLSVEQGDSLDLLIGDSGAQLAPDGNYALFLNDSLGSDDVFVVFAYDVANGVAAAPWDQPIEGYATSKSFDEILDCLVRQSGHDSEADGGTRLQVWFDTIDADLSRTGQIDIDRCLT